MLGARAIGLLVALGTVAVASQALAAFPVTGYAVARIAGYLAAAALVALALIGWGAWPAARLGLAGRTTAAFGVGLTIIGTLLGALVWWWLPGRPATLGLLAVGLSLCWWQRRELFGERAGLGDGSPVVGGALFFLLPPLLLALAPPISLDALVYHLAVPRQFALHGSALELPWNVHSHLARLGEGLFGLTLNLDRWGILAQLLSWTAAAASLLTAARLVRATTGHAGGWAALVLISLPALNVVAGWAWTDWLVVLLALLAVEAWDLHRRRRSDPAGAARAMLALGLFVGGAVAVKYTALPLLALPLLTRLDGAPARRCLLGFGAALLPSLPWTVHNLLVHRNPLYPLFTPAAARLGDYRGEASLFERLRGYLGRPDLLDESLGLLLLPALLLALCLHVAPWHRYRALYLQAALFILAGVMFHPTVRSFAPLLAIGSLAAGAALAAAVRARPVRQLTRQVAMTGLGVALAFNLIQIAWVYEEYDPLSSALGFESEDQYLATGQDYYPTFRIIEQNTAPEEGVLLVGESRSFHLRRPTIAASYVDPHPIAHFRAPGCDPACAAALLKEAGVRTLYLDRGRYAPGGDGSGGTDELTFDVDEDDDRFFQQLLDRHARVVRSRGPVTLYRLSD